MAHYYLALKDEQGIVIETWCLSSEMTDEDADFLIPLAKMGPAALASAINQAIKMGG